MKRKQQLPLPLEIVKDFSERHPNCWDYVEYIREGRGVDLPKWNPLCYCPIAGTQAIMLEKYHDTNVNSAALLSALASWRQYKEIYSFSDELRDTLYEQNDDIVIPTEILYQLPFPCIYISINENKGFFVFFEQDMKTFQMELRFVFAERNGNNIEYMYMWLHLQEGYTVSDGIKEGIKLIKKNSKLYREASIDNFNVDCCLDELFDYHYEEICKNIQLVLYICAENAEVEENPQQKQITRKPPNGSKPKDVYREIRAWDVGVKYAYHYQKAIKAINDASDKTTSTSHAEHRSHRPHTRRGHWHHYWVGSRTDNSRKLILKWTAPIFVGGSSDDTIPTIHKM